MGKFLDKYNKHVADELAKESADKDADDTAEESD